MLIFLNRAGITKICLIATCIVIIVSTLTISRDYQDSWILEGIEIPYLLFVGALSAAFLSENRPSVLVILAILSLFTFLLIPNLKYVWFQGGWIDQHNQYALANNVLDTGHVAPASNAPDVAYVGTPLFHVVFSVLSIVLGAPLLISFKYLPVLFSSIYPLSTYMLLKRLSFLKSKAAKYVLFVSAVPINPGRYTVTGGMFGSVITFLALAALVATFEENDRRYWSIFILLVSALAASHSVTSIILCVCVLGIVLCQRVRPNLGLRTSTVLALISISLAWLTLPAYRTLNMITRQLFVGVPQGLTPGSEHIPPRFFTLAQVNVFEAIKTWLVFYGADSALLILICISIVVALRMLKRSDTVLRFLVAFAGITLALLPIGIVLGLGPVRLLYFTRILFPIFFGIFVLAFIKQKVWIHALIVLTLIALATVELYACQPLIPSANVISNELPSNEPIVYVNAVNTIYQRQMISFARIHIVGLIACDSTTANQIVGLTDLNFSSLQLLRYYPLQSDQRELEYAFFLIHLPGIAGPFDNPAEFRTTDIILGAVNNSNVVYTNGESLVLSPSILK